MYNIYTNIIWHLLCQMQSFYECKLMKHEKETIYSINPSAHAILLTLKVATIFFSIGKLTLTTSQILASLVYWNIWNSTYQGSHYTDILGTVCCSLHIEQILSCGFHRNGYDTGCYLHCINSIQTIQTSLLKIMYVRNKIN